MKKFFCLLAVMACVLAATSLTSCGSDNDEPKQTKEAVTKSQLSTPMFYYRVGSSFSGGMMFWSFTDSKAAFGTMQTVGKNIMRISCSSMYNSWDIQNGKLILGGSTEYEIYRSKINDVYFVFINGGENYASNTPINGQTFEAVFAEMKIDKALLWKALEQSYQSHLWYDITVEE